MKQILEYIVTSLVDNPKEVSVAEENTDGMVNLTITAAKNDLGKLIGKEGKIIRAIRNVMKIPAIKQNVRINVSILDVEKAE